MKKIKLEFELYVLLWPEGLRASRHNLAEKGTGSSLPLGQPKNGDQSGERGSRVFDKVILVDSGHGVPRSIEWREEAFLPQGHITTTTALVSLGHSQFWYPGNQDNWSPYQPANRIIGLCAGQPSRLPGTSGRCSPSLPGSRSVSPQS